MPSGNLLHVKLSKHLFSLIWSRGQDRSQIQAVGYYFVVLCNSPFTGLVIAYMENIFQSLILVGVCVVLF